MTSPLGPPCDLCEEEVAIMSVMDLRDYSTIRLGPACLLPWFKGMVGALTGAQEGDTDTADAAPEQMPEPPPPPPVDDDGDQAAAAKPAGEVRRRRHGGTAP